MSVLFASFLVCHLSLIPTHALYLSVMEVTDKGNTTHISVKVFQNDLQTAVCDFAGLPATGLDEFISHNRPSVDRYFQQHLKLMADGAPMQLTLQQIEAVGDSYWVTFDGKSTNWTRLNIHADYLMEIFPTQENIVTVTDAHGSRKYCRLKINEAGCETIFLM